MPLEKGGYIIQMHMERARKRQGKRLLIEGALATLSLSAALYLGHESYEKALANQISPAPVNVSYLEVGELRVPRHVDEEAAHALGALTLTGVGLKLSRRVARGTARLMAAKRASEHLPPVANTGVAE